MTSHLRTEITIDAAPERVWASLADFANYPEWNPFISRIEGPLVPGEKLVVRLTPPGGKGMTIRPTVQSAMPTQELRWLGHLGVRGLFDGEHIFQLEPTGDGRTRFIHEERFSGIFAPVILKLVGEQTRQGFEAMNQALKERVKRSEARLEEPELGVA